MRKACLFFGLLVLLAMPGCASPFSEFYHDNTGGQDVTKLPSFETSNAEPILTRGDSPDSDIEKMVEDGYGMIGYSSFDIGKAIVNEKEALLVARKIHASVVLVNSHYARTVTGTIPIPITSKDGSSVYYLYIPYKIDRFNYFASYWVKMRPPGFGAYVKDLTQEQRARISGGKGVYVNIVFKNSPAFNADIIKGDIILSIASADIYDAKAFVEAVDQNAGEEVEVALSRDGKEIVKKVKLNPKPR